MAEVVALFGPTGVGKTAVAVALGGLLRDRGEEAVAISADALQVYRGLEVLTGVATPGERGHLEHRLVGIREVTESFSAGEFMPLAHAEIDAALAAGRRPVVVGGTGLYLRAAVTELSLRPPPVPGARERWQRRLAARGAEALHAELAGRDPVAAAQVRVTDRTRIVRALELLDAGEATPGGSDRDQLWTGDTRRPTLLAGLVMDREQLHRRIDARVEAMVAAGAAEEVFRAEAAGASATARAALGYRDLLAGDVEGMKRRTRQLARRQLTWMRKLGGVRLIDATGRSPEDVAAEVAGAAGWSAG